jgi:hypothetical protein
MLKIASRVIVVAVVFYVYGKYAAMKRSLSL